MAEAKASETGGRQLKPVAGRTILAAIALLTVGAWLTVGGVASAAVAPPIPPQPPTPPELDPSGHERDIREMQQSQPPRDRIAAGVNRQVVQQRRRP